METNERIAELEEARNLIREAIMKIENAVRGTKVESRADTYILAHLKDWICSRESTSIINLIKDVQEVD